MLAIIDLPKFNYEDLEEIVAGGQGSFGGYLRWKYSFNSFRCQPNLPPYSRYD